MESYKGFQLDVKNKTVQLNGQSTQIVHILKDNSRIGISVGDTRFENVIEKAKEKINTCFI